MSTFCCAAGGDAFHTSGDDTITFVDGKGNMIDMSEHLAYQDKLRADVIDIVREAKSRGESFPGNVLTLNLAGGVVVVKGMYEQLKAVGSGGGGNLLRTCTSGWPVWTQDPTVGEGNMRFVILMPMGSSEIRDLT